MTLVETIFETGFDKTVVKDFTTEDWDQLIIDFLKYLVEKDPPPLDKHYKTVGRRLIETPERPEFYTPRIESVGNFLIALPQRQREIFVTVIDSWKRNSNCFTLATIYHLECLLQHPRYKLDFYEEVIRYPIFTTSMEIPHKIYRRFVFMFSKENIRTHLERPTEVEENNWREGEF